MTLVGSTGNPPRATAAGAAATAMADLPGATVPLEEILCTEELYRRPRRAPDYQTENRALGTLVQALAERPTSILQTLAYTLLEVFKADSAGLSLLDDTGERFYWPAIAGSWKPHIGKGTPRNFGPCGDVLDRNAPLLFRRWERRYPYLLEATPFAEEGLLVPFHVHGKGVGTIWAIAHDSRRKFDLEDLRQLESFGRFASAAYQAVELARNEEARRATERLNHRLRESERRSREILEALPNAAYTTDAQGRLTFYNQAAVALAGRTPQLGTDSWCVTWRLYNPDGSFLPHDQCPMAVALKEGRPVRGVEAVAERPDGTRVPFMPFPTPLFDAAGNIVGAVNMLVDITERKRAEEYAQRLAAIVEHSDDAILSKDLDGVIQSWNRGAERLFGYRAEEMIGKPIHVLIPPDRQEEEAEILGRIRRDERIEQYETVRRRKDGSLVDIALTVSPLKDAQGRVVGASKIARDITERKRAEARRQLLVNELNHRVKNTLATVQSIAAQTFRGARSDETFKWFEGRLLALSKAHDVLTRENWEGAALEAVVREAVAPHAAKSKDRFEIGGPALRLPPKAALSLAMALHELCTNAAKYGALASEAGRIRIAWAIADGVAGPRLRFRWEERDGPPVAPPAADGFGARLLKRVVPRDLDGDVELSFLPGGVVYAVDAPLP